MTRPDDHPGFTDHAVHSTDRIGVYRPDICVDCLFLMYLDRGPRPHRHSTDARERYIAEAQRLAIVGPSDPKSLVLAASFLITAARTLSLSVTDNPGRTS
jgi:hypothetical protein